MAGYYVAYSRKISNKYKANLRSNVTVFLIFGVFFSFMLPLIVSYSSRGFWIKQFSYREQPIIKFKYEYLIILEYDNESLPGSIICTTNQALINAQQNLMDHCTLLKVAEIDSNKDGKNDKLNLHMEITNVTNLNIRAANLFLIFDYKLFHECVLNIEIMISFSEQFQQPIGRLEIISGINMNIKKPLDCNFKHFRKNNRTLFPKQVIKLHKTGFIKQLISSYASETVQVNLANTRYITSTKNEIAENEPLILTLDVQYDEQLIIYKTKFWELMKWAWIQYISIMALFIFLFKKIKRFVFQNRILQTIKTDPDEENM